MVELDLLQVSQLLMLGAFAALFLVMFCRIVGGKKGESAVEVRVPKELKGYTDGELLKEIERRLTPNSIGRNAFRVDLLRLLAEQKKAAEASRAGGQ